MIEDGRAGTDLCVGSIGIMPTVTPVPLARSRTTPVSRAVTSDGVVGSRSSEVVRGPQTVLSALAPIDLHTQALAPASSAVWHHEGTERSIHPSPIDR